MIFIGDYFALCIVFILCLFFFDSKTSVRYMSAASKLFICCLVSTALTAITDLVTGQLLVLGNVPLWQNMLVNTLYFVVTSSLPHLLRSIFLPKFWSIPMSGTVCAMPASVLPCCLPFTWDL